MGTYNNFPFPFGYGFLRSLVAFHGVGTGPDNAGNHATANEKSLSLYILDFGLVLP
jgi:hypothetical protein